MSARERKLSIAALVIVSISTYSAYVLVPGLTRYFELRATFDTVSERHDAANKLYGRVEDLKAEIVQWKNKGVRLTNANATAAMVQSAQVVVKAAKDAACAIKSIKPESPISRGGLVAVPVVVSIEGTLRQVTSFIARLEAVHPPAAPERVRLATDGTSGLATLQGEFYLYTGEGGELLGHDEDSTGR